jgi:hypothetical protein
MCLGSWGNKLCEGDLIRGLGEWSGYGRTTAVEGCEEGGQLQRLGLLISANCGCIIVVQEMGNSM